VLGRKSVIKGRVWCWVKQNKKVEEEKRRAGKKVRQAVNGPRDCRMNRLRLTSKRERMDCCDMFKK